MTNRRVLLRSRPAAMPSPDNFELVSTPVPQLKTSSLTSAAIALTYASATSST